MATLTTETQKIFEVTPLIIEIAKKLIFQRPGIYKGNLNYWIKEKFRKSTGTEVTNAQIELAYLQLLRDGYFFSLTDSVYSPNHVDHDEQLLTKFTYKNGLSYTDFAILYELRKMGTSKSISKLTRRVVSQGWHDDESEVKVRIQQLFWENLITLQNGTIQVNWEFITDVGR